MKLTKDQKYRFDKIANDVIEFLNEVGNPHTSMLADCESCEIVQGEICYSTDKYFKQDRG